MEIGMWFMFISINLMCRCFRWNVACVSPGWWDSFEFEILKLILWISCIFILLKSVPWFIFLQILQTASRLLIQTAAMEPRAAASDKYFIVIRGKTRKGFCRGCIGRVEAETPHGDITGLLYGTGSPKNGGIVSRENTYPLSRHQAQLLLFVSNAGRRLELLCNPQLFSAICELSLDDLVVVKHRKGHIPGVVKNLMQVGRKENRDDLHMLGFEVEFMVGRW